MAKRNRIVRLSRLRLTRPPRSTRAWWPWCVVAIGAIGLGFAIVRSVVRQDNWLQWRQSLEQQAAGFAWPPWERQWPALPLSPRTSGDFSGPYAFAALHVLELRHIPCFCGCERQGHKSNADCYLRGMTPSGMPIWDDHSFTCATSVNVTREVALMMKAGRPLSEIRREIEAHHRGGRMSPPPVLTSATTR